MAPHKPQGKTANPVAGGVRGARVQKQRKKHKVVLESADSKNSDEKLRMVVRPDETNEFVCTTHIV